MKKVYLFFSCLILIICFNTGNVYSQVTLNLKLFIEGYYLGSGQMNPVMFNQAVSSSNAIQTDTIIVDLHDGTNTSVIVASFKGILLTDGAIICSFPAAVNGKSCYIAIRHRSIIQTWSAVPVLMLSTTNYDFSSAACQAYGCNMIRVDFSPDIWAFYSGDVNQDENIDLFDFIPMMNGVNNGLFGYYATDLNGDGNVDLLDFPIIDANINKGIYSHHP